MLFHLKGHILRTVIAITFFATSASIYGQNTYSGAFAAAAENTYNIQTLELPLFIEESYYLTSYGTITKRVDLPLYFSLTVPRPETFRFMQLKSSVFLFFSDDFAMQLGYRLSDNERLAIFSNGAPVYTFFTSAMESGLLYRVKLNRGASTNTVLFLHGGLEWIFAGLDPVAEKLAVSAPGHQGYQLSVSNSIPVDVGYYSGLSFYLLHSESFQSYLGFRYSAPILSYSAATIERPGGLLFQAGLNWRF